MTRCKLCGNQTDDDLLTDSEDGLICPTCYVTYYSDGELGTRDMPEPEEQYSALETPNDYGPSHYLYDPSDDYDA